MWLMKLFWKLYSFLFLTIILSIGSQLLDPNAIIGAYYNTTIVFSKWFAIPYLLNILNFLVSATVAVFLLGYAFDVQSLSRAPRWLFYLRVLSDCSGHNYEWQSVLAGFAQSKLAGSIALASLTIPLLPSYILQYKITFKKK